MADDEEKTEEPTSKKIEDAKKEGNVGKSTEVVGAAVLLFGSVYILFFSTFSLMEIKKLMLYSYSFIGEEMNDNVYYTIVYSVGITLLKSLAPLFILVFILVLAGNWMQFGFISVPLKFDLQKLNPIKGLQNIFSFKKLLEALKLTAKLTIIVAVMFLLFSLTYKDILYMMNQDTNSTLKSIVDLSIYFILTILFIIIIFAIMDFYFTKFYYMKSLKMSKQEIKDEYKNMEGDPQVKGRIRRIQMQMAQKRMMSNVPSADVIITNPTHYAVALSYDNEKNKAPVVVAKGIDFIAIRIKEVARENDIPIIENPALARSLFEQIDLDREIPNDFYKAMAEIFSYVYELKRKR
ncbi:flagellar biosynthesis protein FlhB [Aliarcobacter cibarius]|uniref:Flagellar biosynthetic protein FlhB n=1 Tax=Aliarcobacter cibarius TaxID=255507 RepID=A0A5J6RFG0_9BACT|nr:flagellar biosynthesis protein FlhB [Aliarcobacter cibarius]QEZ88562.1 flagellar export apparatus, transmembrane gate complex, FlhB component [Aliarcobacter cibarius]QKJ26601.1 flagellar export apparatus, transmembrane gate complex, FlhB component [Aliarcobacter cibarius]TLS98956.1 flagellar biosynthesis protein FlhB [Aliarcobacter cibarius]TLS99872.1 flagellar biosynthesis protein FlhB [Aliarcobacter cibarius]TLT03779.1 flagellar biosynthesis protein FlhB [Aliarcobacter cibarius]